MSKQSIYKKYLIFKVEVDAVGMADAIHYLSTMASDPTSASCYVVKPYVEFLDQAYDDPQIVDLLNHSELCLPDGVALQWAAKYLHGGAHTWWRCLGLAATIVLAPSRIRKPLPEKYGGTNFTWPLLRASRDQGMRVFLIGSPIAGDILHTESTIKHTLPGIKIVGTMPGEIAGMKQGELLDHLKHKSIPRDIVKSISDTKPDLILVGMGFPLQEYVMAHLANQLKHGVLIGEGGTFDYDSFGGNRRKAPSIMQKLGLEWLWRLVIEPKRWRRQMAIPRFMLAVYRSSRHAVKP